MEKIDTEAQAQEDLKTLASDWWTLYQRCRAEGFSPEYSIQLVVAYIGAMSKP